MDRDSPPFWFQPPTTPSRTHRRPHSPIINPVILIILLPILTLLIIFFLLPSFLSHASLIFRPNSSVKKSWDSINIFLVLFAILCGVLARRNDDASPSEEENFNDTEKLNTSVSNRWFDDSDRKAYSSPVGIELPGTGVGRLRRSSNSYPDLRQESLWETGERRYRFYDDFDVNLNRSTVSDYVYDGAQRSEIREVDRDETFVKVWFLLFVLRFILIQFGSVCPIFIMLMLMLSFVIGDSGGYICKSSISATEVTGTTTTASTSGQFAS